MSVRRLSISVPPEVEETIRRAAQRAGKPVSAWLAEAAAEKAAFEQRVADGQAAAGELVREYETEFGPLPGEARARAREALFEAGLLDHPDRPGRAAG